MLSRAIVRQKPLFFKLKVRSRRPFLAHRKDAEIKTNSPAHTSFPVTSMSRVPHSRMQTRDQGYKGFWARKQYSGVKIPVLPPAIYASAVRSIS